MSLSLTTDADAAAIAQRLLTDLLDDRAALFELARDLSLPQGGRAWIRVAGTADADAWLIGWNRSSHVGSHDHGGSHGSVHVLRGGLVETFREADDPSTARVRRLGRGSTVSVPPGRVHDVANAGYRPALSLHVYSPRLTTMTFYSPDADTAPDEQP